MKLRTLLARYALALFASAGALVVHAAEPTEDWPQWRGPQRDGISQSKGLLKEWPKEGPKLAWQVDNVGVGYSSLAVQGDRIYTLGDLDGVEHVLALSASDGKRLWAVQPGPAASLLELRVAEEFKQLDRNQDGQVDEREALERFGWEFNRFDRPVEGEAARRLADRSAALFKQLDKDADGKMSLAEAGNALRDRFERADLEDKAASPEKLASDRTAALVQAADKDSDGRITRQESRGTPLDRIFGRADEKDPATNKGDDVLTVAEIEKYFAKSEPGRDGVLTAAELAEFFQREKPAGDGQLNLAELRAYYGGYRNGMGDGPRGTPTIDGDRLYVEGGNGDVACLDSRNGQTLWHASLTKGFGGSVPGWGYSESPLIVDNMVIVTPGGKQGTLVALDKLTGAKIWHSEGLDEPAHYASPLVAQIAGTRQIVQFGSRSVFGVSPDDGKLLWKYASPANGTANCCMPVVDEDLVFASSSYGVGGGLARITGGGKSLNAEEVYFEKKMACHHGGIVKIGEYMYSNGGGALMCMHFKTGKIAWQNRSVGKGSLIYADGMLYVFSEGHEVALVEANPEAYHEHGRFKINGHGRPSWAHPVLAGGRLYLRDQEWLGAYEVR